MTSFAHRAELAGRRVLVTGASSGIGATLAESLTASGARVAILARRSDALNEVRSRTGALSIVADVTDESSVAAGIEHAADHMGGIDVVINNAGIGIYGPFLGSDIARWQRMVDINLIGTLRVTHHALPFLQESEAADIVNVSSATTHKPPTSINGIYVATKLGVRAFSDSLREELRGTSVRVTTLSPGAVKSTDITASSPDESVRSLLEKRIAEIGVTPIDVARAAIGIISTPRHVGHKEVLVLPCGHE